MRLTDWAALSPKVAIVHNRHAHVTELGHYRAQVSSIYLGHWPTKIALRYSPKRRTIILDKILYGMCQNRKLVDDTLHFQWSNNRAAHLVDHMFSLYFDLLQFYSFPPLVLRAGLGFWLHQFLVIAYLLLSLSNGLRHMTCARLWRFPILTHPYN